MIIREASVEDYASIAHIIRHGLGYSCEDEIVKKKLGMLDKEREKVYVAEIDNKVVGYVHGDKFELLYMESLINVLCLAVDETYRNNGIGGELLKYIERWAKSKGAVGLRLNSAMTRKDAHEFYRRKGFIKERDQIRFIKLFEENIISW